jgi:SAM-dependent methyltransferase
MSGNGAEYWDKVAREWFQDSSSYDLSAEHTRKTYLALIARWADVVNAGHILKTDLFQESFGQVRFLYDVAQLNGNVIGIDVSREVVDKAKRMAADIGMDAGKFICCDVRRLPLQANSVGLIISDSTLDHFPGEEDIALALKELGRVLRVGGTLILTMDNKSNLTYPPYILIRLWMRLGLAPYYIGRTLSPARLRRTLEEVGFAVEECTAIFHCPHPDIVVTWLERSLRRLGRGKFDDFIRKALASLEKLGERRTKFLTGRYIAVKAVKREGG